jgi:2-C-methyl-D-erythritol 4-phosphate cytidylyltransferase
MKIGLVLACAGRGRRLKETKDKALINLGGKPLFYHSFKVFSQVKRIKQIVIVLRKRYFTLARRYVPDSKVILVEGGRRRQDSVYKGIMALDKTLDYVIIHDGARPFITKEKVNEIIESLARYGAVTLGLPIKEAVKFGERGFITKSLEREDLYLIQTPQGFRKNLLLKAYARFKDRDIYDEAQLIELLREKIKIIPGDLFNIKITYPQDLLLARAILKFKIGNLGS